MVASKYDTKEPRNIREAMEHPEWNNAISKEITNIHMLLTWMLVPQTEDMNVLSSRWVYYTKLNPDGTVRKHRPRLVAKGCEQVEGVDYLETFTPVVITAKIRYCLT